MPDALFVIDVGVPQRRDCRSKKARLPIIAVVDTNHNPEGVDYVIPATTTRAGRSGLMRAALPTAVLEGRSQVVQGIVQRRGIRRGRGPAAPAALTVPNRKRGR